VNKAFKTHCRRALYYHNPKLKIYKVFIPIPYVVVKKIYMNPLESIFIIYKIPQDIIYIILILTYLKFNLPLD